MAEVRWTPQAADDLEAITDFISHDSPNYARLFVMDVLEAVERLADFPLLGRIVPEAGDPTVREVILGSYRVIYRVLGENIEILTVYRGRGSWIPPACPKTASTLPPLPGGRGSI